MSEAATLVGHSFAYVALLAALGSGPVLALAPRRWESALLAPVVGFGAAAAFLTSLALVLPMRVAAWAFLLPAAIVSVGVALWLGWRRNALGGRWSRAAAVPLVIGLLGLFLALLPGLLRGTEGPIDLAVYDGLGYVQADEWLQEHTSRDAPAADALRFDLSDAYGRALVDRGQRFGVSAVNAAVASLFLAEPDQTHLAYLATLFAMLPLGIWVVSRALGARVAGAAFGSLFGLSPALLNLVVDSALANLAVLVLIPPALLFGALWLRGGGIGQLVLAALLAAGIIAIYPEFILPLLAVAGLGVLGLLVAERARIRDRAWLQRLVLRLLALAAAATALTPVGTDHAYAYLANVGAFIGGQPPRFLTGENGGAWAFGTVYLYELPRFELFSSLKLAFAIVLPLALALLLLLGLARTTLLRAVFVASPILVAIATGLVSFNRYDNGSCEYCLWKSLTLLLPFVAIGLALGMHALLAEPRRPSVRGASYAVAGILAATAVASLVRSNADLTRAQYETAAVVSPDMRDVQSLTSTIPSASGLLLEGVDATAAPKWTTPAIYYFAALDRAGPRISLVPSADAGLYVGLGLDVGGAYYSPDYDYVLTAFGGVESGRVPLGQEGGYTLYQRAPVDVSVVGTGWAIDPAEGANAIPWPTKPFQLWVSRGGTAGPIALVVVVERPVQDAATLRFSLGGQPLAAFSSADKSRLCVQLEAGQDPIVVDVEPVFTRPPPASQRPTETAPIPPPAKVLGLSTIRAEPGTCLERLPEAFPRLRYDTGWYPRETNGEGASWRWMGTRATLSVGDEGQSRPRMQFRATVGSLSRARTLTARLGGRLLGSVAVPAGFLTAELVLEIPAGEGSAVLELEARPAAESAESVTPGDRRLLAVVMSGPTLTPLP